MPVKYSIMLPRINISFSFRRQCLFVLGKPYTPQSNEFLLNHARTGLLIALQALGLKENSRVGVMAYNCHTVTEAVVQAGCKPVFIDVTDMLQLDKQDLYKKSQDIDTLIVTHLFGIENDITSIREIIKDVPIIEDCAHAGGKVHTEGDFAVYSIGQGKLPSIGDGGILVVNNRRWQCATEQIYRCVPSYTRWQETKLWMQLWIKAVLYAPVIYDMITYRLKQKRNEVNHSMIDVRRMSKGIRAIYNTERKNIDSQIVKQQKNAAYWNSQMKDMVQGTIVGDNAFMLVAHTKDVDALKRWFKRYGIETATHFAHTIDWAEKFGYKRGTCPTAEKLTKELLMVPTYSL